MGIKLCNKFESHFKNLKNTQLFSRQLKSFLFARDLQHTRRIFVLWSSKWRCNCIWNEAYFKEMELKEALYLHLIQCCTEITRTQWSWSE